MVKGVIIIDNHLLMFKGGRWVGGGISKTTGGLSEYLCPYDEGIQQSI